MFTGIVQKTARVLGMADGPGFRRLTLVDEWNDLKLGESIAVNGCCLTIAELPPGEVGFDVIAETLAKTNLGLLRENDRVNVERSLRLGDRLDGHFVQGHIDGRAMITDIHSGPDECRMTLQVPQELAKYLAPKGSVTLDGVSLTLAAVEGQAVQVALIPTTLTITNLGTRTPGWPMNLEVDILSKTVIAWLERNRQR